MNIEEPPLDAVKHEGGIPEDDDRDLEEVKRMVPWMKQITVRGILSSLVIGTLYSVIVMKSNLSTGLVPNLNVSDALLAFAFMQSWTKLMEKAGIVSMPFTQQENTVIQTCAVACYSIAVGGRHLLAGVDTPGNRPRGIKEPGIGGMTGFLFVSIFVGLLALVPLRKIMIIDYKLSFPSGTATAVLIMGSIRLKETRWPRLCLYLQEAGAWFMKSFSFSFLWAFFQWFYPGGAQCGFSQFPTFGLKAWRNSFYFVFSMTYVGAGMICSRLVNFSLLLGAVLSWELVWPLIGKLKGDWFPASLPESSKKSLNGYKVFISISLIHGDGLYNFLKILLFTSWNIYASLKHRNRKSAGSSPKATKIVGATDPL